MNIKNTPSNPGRVNNWRRRAFTLVELLLVLTILAILAGIVLPKFTGIGDKAKISAAKTDIASFKTGLQMYEIEMGSYPKGRNGLQDLITRPSGGGTKWRKFMDVDKIPNDPWGQPYVYENPGKHNPDGYDLYSLGANGRGGNEAIGNWTPPAGQ